MTSTAASPFRLWHIGFALVCAAWLLQKLGWFHPAGEWDFSVYYHAAAAWHAGLNPYDPRVLPHDLYAQGLKFSYPPYALALFRPFTALSLLRATQLFLAVKLLALGWLIVIWSRLLRTSIVEPLWVLFLLFAYSSAIFVDLIAGSVTTFEELLIWSGVAALFQRRHAAFAASVAVAALFRMTPIVLLIVALAIPDRRLFKAAATAVVVFAAVLITTYLIAPTLMTEFLRSISNNMDERGWLNPSALTLAADVIALAARRPMGVARLSFPLAAAYLAIVVAVAVPTVVAIRRAARSDAINRVDVMVYVAILATALVLPRFKNYSYMLLIVPTYYIATRSTQLRRVIPLVLIASLPIHSWITKPELLDFVGDYSKWLIALGAWALYLFEIQRGALLQPRNPTDVTVVAAAPCVISAGS